MTISGEAHRHLLVFFLGGKDDDKLPCLSSSFGFFSCVKDEMNLEARHHLLVFFLRCRR